jgi:GntR family transcriptional regulator, transcriptional repressor for pyruvate dehydrogenase complex
MSAPHSRAFEENEQPRSGNIAEGLFENLRAQILRGELRPGERLRGERELAAAYGTNRNTLREAVRKLEQARLVTIRHGRGVTVCDFRRTGTLDLIYPYLQSGPELQEVLRIVEDVLMPRALLLEYAARLAVERALPEDITRLQAHASGVAAAFETQNAAQVAQAFDAWLEALVDAGHSVAVRWIANPFMDATRLVLEKLPELWVIEPSFPGYIRDVVQGIATRDEALSTQATRQYYERVDGQLLALLRLGIPATASGNILHPHNAVSPGNAE